MCLCIVPEKLVALICAHNEAATIGRLIESLKKARERRREGGHFAWVPLFSDVLVVDDGSKDRTAFVARQAGASVIRLPKNVGKATAFFAGVKKAHELHAEILVTLDADLKPVTASQVKKLVDGVRVWKRQMAIGTVVGDAYFMSGQRAILMRALQPLINGNPKWNQYFGVENGKVVQHRRYGLETALDYLVRKNRGVVDTRFETRRVAGVKTSTDEQAGQSAKIIGLFVERRKKADLLRAARKNRFLHK